MAILGKMTDVTSDFFADTSVMVKPGTGNAESYSPLALAWLGDAVFELLVRSRELSKGNAPADALARAARRHTNAGAQSGYYAALEPLLTDEERAVLKRGRNAKSTTRAKSASVVDYRRATGVEALFGYLYLRGDSARILELFAAL